MTRLAAFLSRHRHLAVDTSVFIYQFESNPTYAHLTDPVFTWIERLGHSAVTSTVVLTELLAQPYRLKDDRRVDLYFSLLTTFPNLTWIAPTVGIANNAAKLRARHSMRTPDAILAATAVHAGATGLVTNDSVFRRVEGFECLVLDSLLN